MKITNTYNLPVPILNAVGDVYKPKPNRLSITRLIDSPLVLKLLTEHWDELEEDASSRLWALLGQAMDSILTKNAPKHWIVQEKIEVPFNGITIVGKADYFDPETGTLGDWKATSVWQYIFDGKRDWEKQLNCYAWLERKKGREVKKLVAHRLFRDHQQSKVLQNPDYPPIPFMSLDILLWSPEKQDEYMETQTQYHLIEKNPECTDDEKWMKPTTYAVMRKGRKSALRVLNCKAAAGAWMGERAGLEPKGKGSNNLSVVERLGECTRCKSYCPVRAVCPNNIYRGEKNEADSKTAS